MRNVLRNLLAACILAAATPAAAQDALTGTWAVLVKGDGGGTCPDNDVGGTWQWLVSIDQNGLISVQVIGQTGFPKLYGQFGGKDLVFEGASAHALGTGFAGVHASSIFTLRLENYRLVGKRYYLGTKPNPLGGGTSLCMAIGSVTAQQLMGQTADSERAARDAPRGPAGATPAVH